MEVFVDNVIEAKFDFDYMDIAYKVCETVLELEKCPFDCEINITITDNDEIHQINKETRGIDRPTDVLSFPNLYFDEAAQFDSKENEMASIVDPESELVVLGDIILSYDKILQQAGEYGHSVLREYAFLIAHSMLHLCGFDHMEADDAALMEEQQRMVMDKLGIGRG